MEMVGDGYVYLKIFLRYFLSIYCKIVFLLKNSVLKISKKIHSTFVKVKFYKNLQMKKIFINHVISIQTINET